MTTLYILYDADCELCRRCREWLSGQEACLRLEFLSFQEALRDRRFAVVAVLRPDREMVVVADTGEVWQGATAWVMCLWAIRRYRRLAEGLARSGGWPVARRLVTWMSGHRRSVSAWLRPVEAGCAGGTCALPVAGLPERDRFHEALERARIEQR